VHVPGYDWGRQARRCGAVWSTRFAFVWCEEWCPNTPKARDVLIVQIVVVAVVLIRLSYEILNGFNVTTYLAGCTEVWLREEWTP
jgi:hypothetical protein